MSTERVMMLPPTLKRSLRRPLHVSAPVHAVTMRRGLKRATQVVGSLARAKIFRARDLKHRGVSPTWMGFFEFWAGARHHGLGVWSTPDYRPTRYERVQIRFPRAVFCGASALWLLGELATEPEELWIAIDNKARPPRTIDSPTVIIRTRRLEEDVVLHQPAGCELTLRVRAALRARAEMSTRTRTIRKAAPAFIRWDPTKLPPFL